MMDCLKQPAFIVGDIDEDIDLSIPPSSGEEYIKRVVIEARHCADVVVADLDPTCVKEPTKAYVETLAGCVQAPTSLKPTVEWQQYQVADFSKLRLYVSRLKEEILIGKRKWRPPDIHLPDIDDQNAWISFCLGDKEKFEPTLNTLFCFNQLNMEQVLEYLVQFVETERRIEYKIGQWIYTLLVILEQPLQPDTCSCLRSLARACSVIRADSRRKRKCLESFVSLILLLSTGLSQLLLDLCNMYLQKVRAVQKFQDQTMYLNNIIRKRELDAQELGALNLFICLVARYFRQLDLADL